MAEKVRIGLIGCGGMANSHLRWLSEIPEAEVSALNDVAQASIDRTFERNPHLKDVPVYEDYRALLADENVDAVQIHSPHTCHFEQAMAALDAGKHVLLEKPMVTRTEDAHRLIER
jgi:predicted dehydrogenase